MAFTVFADTPVPASASTRILAGKPLRAMSSAAMLLHLYWGIADCLSGLSGALRPEGDRNFNSHVAYVIALRARSMTTAMAPAPRRPPALALPSIQNYRGS